MRRRKKAEPEKINTLLWKVLKKTGYEKAVKEHQIVLSWEEIVGERIAKVTEVGRVENECLFIKVSSASWRNELVYLKPEIIKKINSFAGKWLVKDVIFTNTL